MDGWIKIHRKMLKWEWYDEANTFRVFFHLLLTCNFKPTRWRGIELRAGESIKSLETLAKEMKLSVRNIRTSVNHLKSTGEVTERKTGKHRVLVVTNYSSYQVNDSNPDTLLTGKRQGSDREVTADKERKEVKKEKNIINIRFSPPAIEEVKNLFLEKGIEQKEAITFWNFYESKNWMVGKNKMKNWKAAGANWISRNSNLKKSMTYFKP